MMAFPFFRFYTNTRYSNHSLDKTLNIVYNWLARRFPTKKGRDGFFTLYGAPRESDPASTVHLYPGVRERDKLALGYDFQSLVTQFLPKI